MLQRNNSTEIVDRRETPDKHEERVKAEEKIKAINLEEKINALRLKFGGHQRKSSASEIKKSARASISYR